MRPALVRSALLASAALVAGVGLAGLTCAPASGTGTGDSCAGEAPETSINVAGTYRYSGDSIFRLRGTITFAQDGNLVTVTGTTYDNSGDRDLICDATPLQGNKLVAVLRPKNGDPDYHANVTFLFSEDGNEFCVGFDDTNEDSGPMGTYRATRVAQ